MTPANLLLIISLIMLNGFFVAVEFAAVSSRRTRLELLDENQGPASKLVRAWLEQPSARDRLIAATQLGITLVSLALGAVGENAFQTWLEPYFSHISLPNGLFFLEGVISASPLIISLAVITSLHVVLGEQVPKVAVLRSPERFALFAAPIMQVFSIIFKWFIDILDWATRLVLRLIGLPADSQHTFVFSPEEIKQMVNDPDAEGIIEESERDMISAVIDFGDLVVRQVCIPRVDIISVQAETPLSELIQIASKNAITKIPVYGDSLEQIIGIVHVIDILKNISNKNTKIKAREMAREALFVPENIPVNDLLNQFRAHHAHIAIVLDEYGGTAGLVTLHDLLEEIVGSVQDTFDNEPPAIQSMPDGSSLVEGTELIEDINERFGISLKDANYDTIAGFILGKLERIPLPGDIIEDDINHVRLKVESMEHLRISLVRIMRY
jgi:putative hemolysin